MYHGNQYQHPDRFQRPPSSTSFYDQFHQHHQRGGAGPPPRGFPPHMHRQQLPHPQFSMGMRGGPGQSHSNRFHSPNYRGQHSRPYRGGHRGGRSQPWGKGRDQPHTENDIARLYYKHSMVEDPWAGMEAVSTESHR
ncbi:uncharacterized protein LOC144433829 isoform X2 [Glandiceps talaboti]